MAGGPDGGIGIRDGWRPGLLGRIVALHAEYYAHAHGFGAAFECTVARGLADFVPRLDRPGNRLWTAVDGAGLCGAIAIDGEHLGDGSAHLRWFIVADRVRGSGLGRRLLATALAFCDAHGFARTQLWTFEGLHAARHLYEASGFVQAAQWPGTQWGAPVQEQRFVRERQRPPG